MSFTVEYDLEKRPKQIFPDGREEYQEDAGRWALFQQAEEARQAAEAPPRVANNDDGGNKNESIIPLPEERTPQKAIDKLLAARGELDVILDLISLLEQQQFMSLAHVPFAKSTAATAHQAALRLARRRAQLHATAERLRTGTAAAVAQSAISDRFLDDLAELRKTWKLGRRSATAGKTFFIDISLSLPMHYSNSSAWTDLQRAEATQITILPAADGEACVVLDSSAAVVKGPLAITRELQKVAMMHSWWVLQRIIEVEAQQSAEAWQSGDGAVAAILSMVAVAVRVVGDIGGNSGNSDGDVEMGDVADEINEKEESKKIALPGRSTAAADIVDYCDQPNTQLEFEARALRCLADLCKEAHTPFLIKHIIHSASSSSLEKKENKVLDKLVKWVRHAALCNAVEKEFSSSKQQISIEKQQPEVAAFTSSFYSNSSQQQHHHHCAAWKVGRLDGRPVGIVRVEGDEVHWQGPSLSASRVDVRGSQLGRRLVATLVNEILKERKIN